MRTLIKLIKENITHRDQMWTLAKSIQKVKFKGSDAGFLWAILKPTMYICVFYFAITIGFKSSKSIDGLICPYFIWLTIGMVAFFYMRDMILNGASCFRKNANYVSKAKYPVGTLPISVSLSYLLIHFVMLGLGFVICFLFGVAPSIYWIQIPFYTLLMFIMACFWSIGTGLISVMYKDFYNFLQLVNQAVFWLSAILFDLHRLSPSAQKVFLFNPISYIVEGYRNAVCRHIWFFEEPLKFGCFMIVLVVMAAVAILMYKKLIKRIPDVL
ncbi:MAG: ABC transporter permease [Firmicutes bacterium]|nr:ABC transporter permease [Bacillota bacterium]